MEKTFGNVSEFKFQAVLFGRDAFYIEGARPVKLGADEMIFSAAGALIRISGEEMSVKELSGDCVSITGKICGFEVKDL